MKKAIYSYILGAFVLLSSAFSLLMLFLSQETLNELMETNPSSVVSFGDSRFIFTVLMFFICTVLTYYYITTYTNNYTKKDYTILTIVALVASIGNFLMLNYTWQFAFIGLAISAYEVVNITTHFNIVKKY